MSDTAVERLQAELSDARDAKRLSDLQCAALQQEIEELKLERKEIQDDYNAAKKLVQITQKTREYETSKLKAKFEEAQKSSAKQVYFL